MKYINNGFLKSNKMTQRALINELKTVSRIESIKGYCYELTNKISRDPIKKTFIIKHQIDLIKQKVSEKTGVSTKAMESGITTKGICKAKYIAISECCRLKVAPMRLIALEFGYKKGTPHVIYACKQVQNQYDSYEEYRQLVDSIRNGY